MSASFKTTIRKKNNTIYILNKSILLCVEMATRLVVFDAYIIYNKITIKKYKKKK